MEIGDAMQEFKSQLWQNWFTQPVPRLDNMSPNQACKTARGRKLLDDLLAMYDSFRGGGGGGGSSLDMNIPTRYAKWKLGYGPGSAEEFAQEEAVMNLTENSGGARRTQRTERHTKKLEKKKAAIFIPKRCEVVGCEKRGDDVKACSGCNCAYYCGKEHQLQDWKRHKLDCKALKKLPLELQPRPFESKKELEKYPLGCFQSSSSSSPAAASMPERCFICHSRPSEVDLCYTHCCNLPVCDNAHEYQMMSYSRDFCSRSHDSYTSCSSHCHNEHAGDWRECVQCNRFDEGARPFRSTNRFCITPCLERFLPQGSMLTFACDGKGCKNRMLPGHSSYSSKLDTATGARIKLCSECKIIRR